MANSFFALVLSSSWISAQNLTSRGAQIDAARDEKAQALRVDPPTRMERGISYFQGKMPGLTGERSSGLRLKFGGAGGISLGPEYRKPIIPGTLFRSSAQFSVTRKQKYDLQFSVPGGERSRVVFDLYGVHRNYPRLNYYGPGPDSRKGSRSNFRLEDTALSATLASRMISHLYGGVSLGYLFVNVGPGTAGNWISTEQVFSTEGIARQANFQRHGAFVEFDYRDNPAGPRSGGSYRATYIRYFDRTLGLHDFDRAELHIQQYFPFFNKKRVFALRGKTALSLPRRGHSVPFYLQPTLGGADYLRGFRSYRFYDDNMVVFNAEYRWEAFSGLDMAAFADAGKVFSRPSQLNLGDLESSVGFGMRFNAFNNVFLRLDVGFSHEGIQAWLKFDNIFEDEPARPPLARAVF